MDGLIAFLVLIFMSWRVFCGKVDCWRERVSNVSELNSVIEVYPTLLSYSLDASVSRADFVIQVCTVRLAHHQASRPVD